ncbi:jhamt [Trichonephila clavata]|uniref:Jhamt n=1 Tax=Trichonephila clavata TaxID=2740835 RepID=A0A8X6KED2_TRICU|nr:jhamt [Trichonephila clavata]
MSGYKVKEMTMSTDKNSPELHYYLSEDFVKLCAQEFQWRDLSRDVVMDINCGNEFYCCKFILEEFPDVSALVAIDNVPKICLVRKPSRKIHVYHADIVERETLKQFQGKMDKAVSANTFHLITEKKMAFENVYRLLKPAGEAAFLFYLDSELHSFKNALLEMPKFKALHKGTHDPEMYSKERDEQYYRRMLEEIGFHNVRSKREQAIISFPLDENCKAHLLELYLTFFKKPSENVNEIKEELFKIYKEMVDRYKEKLCYRIMLLKLFGVKPT